LASWYADSVNQPAIFAFMIEGVCMGGGILCVLRKLGFDVDTRTERFKFYWARKKSLPVISLTLAPAAAKQDLSDD
jgi:hypothetical protein